MWNYEKRLQYPINIKNCNPTLAAMIISQYGGLYFNKVYNIKKFKILSVNSTIYTFYTLVGDSKRWS